MNSWKHKSMSVPKQTVHLHTAHLTGLCHKLPNSVLEHVSLLNTNNQAEVKKVEFPAHKAEYVLEECVAVNSEGINNFANFGCEDHCNWL